MAHAPPGHHSVIGRPSAGGLHFPEYVVYRGEQVIITLNLISKLFFILSIICLGIPGIFDNIFNCKTRR